MATGLQHPPPPMLLHLVVLVPLVLLVAAHRIEVDPVDGLNVFPQ
jgi:hypothetical protein